MQKSILRQSAFCVPLLALAALSTACRNNDPPKINVPLITKLWQVDKGNALGQSLVGDLISSQEYPFTGQLYFLNLTDRSQSFRIAYTDKPDLTRGGYDYSGQKVVTVGKNLASRFFSTNGPAIQIFTKTGQLIKRFQLPYAEEIPYGSYNRLVTNGDLLLVPSFYRLDAYRISDLNQPNLEPKPIWTKDLSYTKDGYNLADTKVDQQTHTIYTLAYDIRDGHQQLWLAATAPSGEELWRKEVWRDASITGRAGSRLAVGNNRIVVFRSEGSMAAFDLHGEKLWDKPLECHSNNMINFAKINGDKLLIMPGGTPNLCSYNLQTGAQNWIFDGTGAGFGGEFAVAGNHLYISNGRLHAINLDTGKLDGIAGVHASAELAGGTVLYDEPRNQLLIWSSSLWAFQPLKD